MLLGITSGCSHKQADCLVLTDALDDTPSFEALQSVPLDWKTGGAPDHHCDASDADKARRTRLRDGDAIVLFDRYVRTKKDVCGFKSNEHDLKAIQEEVRSYCSR